MSSSSCLRNTANLQIPVIGAKYWRGLLLPECGFYIMMCKMYTFWCGFYLHVHHSRRQTQCHYSGQEHSSEIWLGYENNMTFYRYIQWNSLPDVENNFFFCTHPPTPQHRRRAIAKAILLYLPMLEAVWIIGQLMSNITIATYRYILFVVFFPIRSQKCCSAVCRNPREPSSRPLPSQKAFSGGLCRRGGGG